MSCFPASRLASRGDLEMHHGRAWCCDRLLGCAIDETLPSCRCWTRASLMLRSWRFGSRLTLNAVAISGLSAELHGVRDAWWKEAPGLDAPCTVAPTIEWDSPPRRELSVSISSIRLVLSCQWRIDGGDHPCLVLVLSLKRKNLHRLFSDAFKYMQSRVAQLIHSTNSYEATCQRCAQVDVRTSVSPWNTKVHQERDQHTTVAFEYASLRTSLLRSSGLLSGR